MNRVFGILLIIFFLILVAKQSHLIQKKEVWDSRLGVSRVEYEISINNLKKYLKDIPKTIRKKIERIKRR